CARVHCIGIDCYPLFDYW
nr:immunoglobulin heavy chain junction region [Macaca mulatta]MOV48110.1 immunoglobulin heavy chain junction region [Macaca mulatta]MOV48409.1 immunoglobulin heavy chain junction region [Macaca mulatta]